ncbi:ATP-binding cassette domain-containing protein [Chryseobacterium sp. S90]|uniref:ABC transporter ATP-binding protein n=1 Tax=Chryseobacterium sp. S90 TaxID=3395373 RepID=UPI0039BC8633
MITFKNLSFAYSQKKVLNDVNLQYEPGKIYYLLGPNGFGKSTLLRSIAGLHRPKTGSLEVNNHPAFKRNIKLLQDLCFVSDGMYCPDMLITKFAALYGSLYPLFKMDTFYQYLFMFEVKKEAHISELSFGQRKKLFLAFAFATNARIILLDEPINGLDIKSKREFRKILTETANDDKTVIIGTHDVSDMDILADGITVLGQQEVIFHQNTSDILQKLAFDIVKDPIEAKQALYSEQTYQGFMTITPNIKHKETNLNIELLYHALLKQQHKITSLFK